MCDNFFTSVDIPDDVLFNGRGSLNVIHQIGKKVESNFVAHFTLARFFRKFCSEDNVRALLLLSHHGKSHWISIANKLGTNLPALQEQGKLVIIDPMKWFFEDLTTNGGSSVNGSVLCLDRVFDECKERIEEFQRAGSRRILVLVDNLTNYLKAENLDAFHLSEKNITGFLQKLNALSIQADTCSLSITATVQSSDATFQSHFTKVITQTLPSVLFEVSPLKTGFSSHVTGFLKVTFSPRKNRQNHKGWPFIKTYHFKLENNNAVVTPITHSLI